VSVVGWTFQNNWWKMYERFNLKINHEKCHLFQKEVQHLEHTLLEGVTTDPVKLKLYMSSHCQKNKNVLSFLHVCIPYRGFTARYADIAKPLTELIKRNRLFISALKKQKLLSSPCRSCCA
jgi:hypothetical protein